LHVAAEAQLDAHLRKQRVHRHDILQLRDIAKTQRLCGQQGCRQDRQRGILGAGGANVAAKLHPAVNEKLVHLDLFHFASRSNPPELATIEHHGMQQAGPARRRASIFRSSGTTGK